MKRVISLLLCCLFLTMALVSCAIGDNTDPTVDTDPSTEEWGTVFTAETAYAKALALGYNGTLEAFLASIQGAAGVGIQDMAIVSGRLTATLTNGTVIDCGVIYTSGGTSDEDNATADFAWNINNAGTGLWIKSVISIYDNNVIIPETYRGKNVVGIREGAFAGESVRTITVPKTMTRIEEGAFRDAEELTTVTLPKEVTYIGTDAFSDCSDLTRINYGGTMAQWNAISKGTDWNAHTGEYVVVCQDGTITKSGSTSTTPGGTVGGDTVDPPVDDDTDEPVDEVNWYDSIDFSDTTITLQLSELYDLELPNGCLKYMQGPEQSLNGDTGYNRVQNEVLKRNNAAKKALNLNVEYTYINKEWGMGIAASIIESESAGPGYTPDMYCDQMYDMLGASYQHGVFTNILKYTQETQDIAGWSAGNGFFDITNANGYNTKLMEGMALTEDKQFLIASDYYMDVMRAMICMPFNPEMYADYAATDDPYAENLYQMVKDDKWTWDALASFEGVSTASGKATVYDDRVLMALSCGSLSGSAFVYSSGFQNFKYSNGAYLLDSTCAEILNAFGAAAEISRNSAVVCDENTAGMPKGVEACKEVFISGRALFAGPTVLGVVEEDVFMGMNRFSIVPVPKNTVRSSYNTTISSRARVGALSFNSPLKKETSAWIQYSTEKSDAVKTEYFDAVENNKFLSGTGEPDMLNLIYKNLGDNKSMVLDLIVMFDDWISVERYVWSNIIMKGYFQDNETAISTLYASGVPVKQEVLNDVMAAWNKADSITAVD